MKELKSTYDTDFEDFNPACLSVAELSGLPQSTRKQSLIQSPMGKVVPVGLFSRVRNRTDLPTDKVTNIDPTSIVDISKADLDGTFANTQSKRTRSQARAPVMCFGDSKFRPGNFSKSNTCRLH